MAERRTEHILLDCDPGMGLPWSDVDDNLALLMALGSAELQLDLVSVVAGNVPAPAGHESLEVLFDHLEREVPIALGATQPLYKPYSSGQENIRAAAERRGASLSFEGLFEPPTQQPAARHALSEQIRILEASPRPVTIVAVGPLTNIAVLLDHRPDLAERIERIVIMGGAVEVGGNVTSEAEFNVWCDPHAADVVLSSAVETVLVPLDVTQRVSLGSDAFRDALADAGSEETRDYLIRSIEGWAEAHRAMAGSEAFHPHDPLAMAYVIDPSLFDTRRMNLRVHTGTGETYGEYEDEGRTLVCFDVDSERFRRLFFDRLRSAPYA